MKLNKLSLVFLLTVLLVALFAMPARADVSGDAIMDMIDRIGAAVDLLLDEDYNISQIFLDRLTEGESYTVTRRIFEGNDYALVGVGGTDVTDMDLEVQDGRGRSVGTDTTRNATPVVSVVPRSTDVYSFIATVADARGSDANQQFFFAYILAFKRSA